MTATIEQKIEQDTQARAEAIAAIQQLAARIDTHQPTPAPAARALLLRIHPERPDHIALAIGAH